MSKNPNTGSSQPDRSPKSDGGGGSPDLEKVRQERIIEEARAEFVQKYGADGSRRGPRGHH